MNVGPALLEDITTHDTELFVSSATSGIWKRGNEREKRSIYLTSVWMKVLVWLFEMRRKASVAACAFL